MQLIESEWLFIDDIIYKMNAENDFDLSRREFLDSIRILIPCDSATFFLADQEHRHALCNPVLSDFPEDMAQEYMDIHMNVDYAKWLFSTSQGRAYKTSEWFPVGQREQEQYYREYYIKCNIHYAALLTLSYNNEFIGIVCMYRSKTWDDFTERDLHILDILKKHLSLKVHDYLATTSTHSIANIIEANMTRLANVHGLSPREREITSLLLSGLSHSEISQHLSISESTARTHSANIYRKLQISRRAELLRIVLPT